MKTDLRFLYTQRETVGAVRVLSSAKEHIKRLVSYSYSQRLQLVLAEPEAEVGAAEVRFLRPKACYRISTAAAFLSQTVIVFIIPSVRSAVYVHPHPLQFINRLSPQPMGFLLWAEVLL